MPTQDQIDSSALLTSDFDYSLPQELIAQHPIEPRDASRLLVLHPDSLRVEHRHFRDILSYLRPGDLLVANETRVIPARLYGVKQPTGGKVELLLLSRREPALWESLVKGRKIAIGQRIGLLNGSQVVMSCVVEAITPSGGRLLRFDQPIDDLLDAMGVVPLPPYIHAKLDDPSRYQTVYARERGSVAAPTAGLHFTPDLIHQTREMGVEWVNVLLHIGLDTFRPVSEERVVDHQIHTEHCRLDARAAETISKAKREGRRVVAVGTTAVRVLETAARQADHGVRPWDGPTDLYIYPGFEFRIVDALITNFHLPRSSLLMLVSALAGSEAIRHAYARAIAERYRFYSFGDSMFITHRQSD